MERNESKTSVETYDGWNYLPIFQALTTDGTIHKDPSAMLALARETTIAYNWRVRIPDGRYCVGAFLAWMGDYVPEQILVGRAPDSIGRSGCKSCNS